MSEFVYMSYLDMTHGSFLHVPTIMSFWSKWFKAYDNVLCILCDFTLSIALVYICTTSSDFNAWLMIVYNGWFVNFTFSYKMSKTIKCIMSLFL